MGRKLDPTKKEKRGPGRKARKQKGAETELARFLPAAGDENSKRLSSRARKRAAKRRLGSAEALEMKYPGANPLPGKLPKGISAGAVQTPGKKGAQSLYNTSQGKKRPAPAHSSDEEEEEEDSEETGMVNQGDLWGSEDSDADMIDDYGADSSSEDEDEDDGEELLPIERAARKQKKLPSRSRMLLPRAWTQRHPLCYRFPRPRPLRSLRTVFSPLDLPKGLRR
uniref:Uncharacterized protein n=1 Tax=Rousettus aegyptiacus TaxID=9407 RepID=A0A7J8JH92_ROUAE|nr:hypothetical protein HJG63_010313 [Rousettus aegyptiacus]